MGKKSKRVRTKQTDEEKKKAKEVVASAIKEACVLGITYKNNKQKKLAETRIITTATPAKWCLPENVRD